MVEFKKYMRDNVETSKLHQQISDITEKSDNKVITDKISLGASRSMDGGVFFLWACPGGTLLACDN